MQLPTSHQIFSGIPVRAFLKTLNYKPSHLDAEIAMGLVFCTTQATLDARKNSHLTNATEKEHQIRYPLKDRVCRALVKLASDATSNMNIPTFTVAISPDDFIAMEFFKAIKSAQIISSVTWTGNEHLIDAELQLLKQLENAADHMDQIMAKCRERIYTSDYRSVLQILSSLGPELKTDNVRYLMGLCTNFSGETEKSERSFREMLASSNPNARVTAAYVTSMLYLRMHRKEKQNLETAEELLQTAYDTLSDHPEIQDWTFHRVFNRNGYALCLFRRGKVVEALEMLERGINVLKEDLSGANRLHQSVLIYNAVQCLRALNRFADCEAKCEELLSIDPLFPEYHLEQARVFLDQSKNEEALLSIARAEALDGFIPELFALKGYAYLQMNDLSRAAEAYGQAVQLQPDNEQFKNDYEYCLEESSDAECTA